MTPEALLAAARRLVERPAPELEGLWPRATALLLRQALEGAVRDRLAEHVDAVDELNLSVQLVCLTEVLDPALARRAAYAWSAVSGACHHHGYELAPTASDLRTWMEIVREVIES